MPTQSDVTAAGVGRSSKPRKIKRDAQAHEDKGEEGEVPTVGEADEDLDELMQESRDMGAHSLPTKRVRRKPQRLNDLE